eukprot:TRINITY_DN613_c0_g1_i1.p1 TRINITY_DN613_c0_g1~~TRINITY_DN613_c0_g1_i1.p1  ORF type:complete len:991 (+),score=297.29 TRINITY_DN613_c0_g1_i1:152-3124(+)
MRNVRRSLVSIVSLKAAILVESARIDSTDTKLPEALDRSFDEELSHQWDHGREDLRSDHIGRHSEDNPVVRGDIGNLDGGTRHRWKDRHVNDSHQTWDRSLIDRSMRVAEFSALVEHQRSENSTEDMDLEKRREEMEKMAKAGEKKECNEAENRLGTDKLASEKLKLQKIEGAVKKIKEGEERNRKKLKERLEELARDYRARAKAKEKRDREEREERRKKERDDMEKNNAEKAKKDQDEKRKKDDEEKEKKVKDDEQIREEKVGWEKEEREKKEKDMREEQKLNEAKGKKSDFNSLPKSPAKKTDFVLRMKQRNVKETSSKEQSWKAKCAREKIMKAKKAKGKNMKQTQAKMNKAKEKKAKAKIAKAKMAKAKKAKAKKAKWNKLASAKMKKDKCAKEKKAKAKKAKGKRAFEKIAKEKMVKEKMVKEKMMKEKMMKEKMVKEGGRKTRGRKGCEKEGKKRKREKMVREKIVKEKKESEQKVSETRESRERETEAKEEREKREKEEREKREKEEKEKREKQENENRERDEKAKKDREEKTKIENEKKEKDLKEKLSREKEEKEKKETEKEKATKEVDQKDKIMTDTRNPEDVEKAANQSLEKGRNKLEILMKQVEEEERKADLERARIERDLQHKKRLDEEKAKQKEAIDKMVKEQHEKENLQRKEDLQKLKSEIKEKKDKEAKDKLDQLMSCARENRDRTRKDMDTDPRGRQSAEEAKDLAEAMGYSRNPDDFAQPEGEMEGWEAEEVEADRRRSPVACAPGVSPTMISNSSELTSSSANRESVYNSIARSAYQRRGTDHSAESATPTRSQSTETAATQQGSNLSDATAVFRTMVMDEVRRAQNFYRCIHGSPPLRWSVELSSAAQRWADHTEGTLRPSPDAVRKNIFGCGEVGVGENIAKGVPADAAVDVWYDEIMHSADGLGRLEGYNQDMAHYSQLVWKDTKTVGCGVRGDMTVCWYGCAGNQPSGYLSNVMGVQDLRDADFCQSE